MKNRDQWQPSKFVYHRGRLRASRNPNEVSVSSRLNADLVAACYEQYLPKFAHGKLLDLGCGKVPLFASYKDLVAENVCIDWEHSLHCTDHLDRTCDLNGHLPFSDGEFDTILLSDVLEHIAEPQRLMMEIARVLASDGMLLMNVPFFYWLHEQPHDFYRYTEFSLRRFVEIAALRLVMLEPVGGAPEIMTDIFAKNIVRLPILGRTLAVLAQVITSTLLRTTIGKAASMKTRSLFPLGYFLVASKA